MTEISKEDRLRLCVVTGQIHQVVSTLDTAAGAFLSDQVWTQENVTDLEAALADTIDHVIGVLGAISDALAVS